VLSDNMRKISIFALVLLLLTAAFLYFMALEDRRGHEASESVSSTRQAFDTKAVAEQESKIVNAPTPAAYTNQIDNKSLLRPSDTSGISTSSAIVLITNEIDATSVSIIGPDEHPNVFVRLVGMTSEEIESLRRGPADIVVGGITVASGLYGSAVLRQSGTNCGLMWVLKSPAEAEAVASSLGLNITNVWRLK
jgi:hypothetical protein